jgi:hypothetical protein
MHKISQTMPVSEDASDRPQARILACVLRPREERFHKEVLMQGANSKTVAAIFVAAFLVLPFVKLIEAEELPKQQVDVSDDQLRAFAKVYVQVDKIRQEYEPRLKQARDPEEGKQIQIEAVTKMQEAAAKEGITGESYRQIFEIARADEGLRKKLLNFINEEKEKS